MEKGGRRERGGERMLACFQGEDSQGARDRGVCKRRGEQERMVYAW